MSCRTQGHFPSFVYPFVRSFVCSFVCPPPLKSQPRGSNLNLEAQIPASRLKFQLQGSNSSLEAQIPALRLKSHPQGSNPSLEAQIAALRFKSLPQGSNPCLMAQIPASRLKSSPLGSNPYLEACIPALRLKSHWWTDKQTNKSPPVFYPSLTITNIRCRAMGIADHILPLGNWLQHFTAQNSTTWWRVGLYLCMNVS